MRLKNIFSKRDENSAHASNLGPDPNEHKTQSTGFNISDAADMLNQFSEFRCEQFNNGKDEESWVFKKTLILLGKECEIQIEVTVRYDKDLLIFLMPIYDEGSEGLAGEKLDVFNSLIHQFNSRITGGYFTKDTYDDSYALVFMHHLPLSRMDNDWFEDTLDHFVKILYGFRPLFDCAISTLKLKFDENAGLQEPAKKYCEDIGKEYISFGDTKH
jgi:hypothetical protein